jgi:hypothetical protein
MTDRPDLGPHAVLADEGIIRRDRSVSIDAHELAHQAVLDCIGAFWAASAAFVAVIVIVILGILLAGATLGGLAGITFAAGLTAWGALAVGFQLLVTLITPKYIDSVPIFYALSYNVYLASMSIVPSLILSSSIVNKQNITLLFYTFGLGASVLLDLAIIKIDAIRRLRGGQLNGQTVEGVAVVACRIRGAPDSRFNRRHYLGMLTGKIIEVGEALRSAGVQPALAPRGGICRCQTGDTTPVTRQRGIYQLDDVNGRLFEIDRLDGHVTIHD